MSRHDMNVLPKVGDVFLIPLDETSAAGGHIVGIRENDELYLAVMGRRLDRGQKDPEVAADGEPILLTLSFDAKLLNGDWPIIGNLTGSLSRYPHPAFKIRHAGVMSVESRDKSVRRPATTVELNILQNRSIASPAVIEDVIRAHHGLGKWNESYDKRLANYAIISSSML